MSNTPVNTPIFIYSGEMPLNMNEMPLNMSLEHDIIAAPMPLNMSKSRRSSRKSKR